MKVETALKTDRAVLLNGFPKVRAIGDPCLESDPAWLRLGTSRTAVIKGNFYQSLRVTDAVSCIVFETKKRFGLCVLDYVVTSNHVHLLVKDSGGDAIARKACS